jgi:hypothetical protein
LSCTLLFPELSELTLGYTALYQLQLMLGGSIVEIVKPSNNPGTQMIPRIGGDASCEPVKKP